MWVGALSDDEIYPHFNNNLGYWGSPVSHQKLQLQPEPVLLHPVSRARHLRRTYTIPAIRYLLQFTFEQHPGVIDWNGNAVPRTDEISGLPVHLDFRTCHFIFAHAHSSVNLAPVVMHPYSGDWHAGLDIYKQWRATWFGKPHIPDWVKDVNSWQQLQIDGSEQDYRSPIAT